jgi:peptide/nickel transport system substrate-binding protein
MRSKTVGLLPIIALVVACTPATNTTTPAAGGGAKQLVIAAPHTPKSVDFNGLSDAVEFEAVLNMYDDLVDWKVKDGPGGVKVADLTGVEGKLAESWEVSSDGLTYTFHLRKGVKSFFGNELSGNDLKFTWESGFAAKGVALFGDTISNLSSADNVTVVDPLTVKVVLDKPSSIFLKTLTNPTIGAIIDSTEAKKHATSADPYALAWQKSHDMGFGAYHLSELTPDQQAVYVANPNYWQGKPNYDKVIVKVIPESAQRLQLLQGKDIQMAEALAPQELETVRSAADSGKDVKVVTVPGIFNYALRINPTIAPFDDVKLREAIAWAVPYDDIMQQVFLGRGKPMRSFVPEQADGYYPDPWNITTDVEKSKQLLAGSGHSGTLQLDFYYSQAVPAEEQIAILTKSALAKVGIELTLNKVTPAQYTDALFGKKYGFFVDTDAPFVADVGYASWLWFHPKSPINYVNYNDPAVTALIDSALETGDKEAYKQIQAAVDKAFVWIYLVVPDVQVPMSKNINGYTWRPISQVKWYELSGN